MSPSSSTPRADRLRTWLQWPPRLTSAQLLRLGIAVVAAIAVGILVAQVAPAWVGVLATGLAIGIVGPVAIGREQPAVDDPARQRR